jgi:hypothetical protein
VPTEKAGRRPGFHFITVVAGGCLVQRPPVELKTNAAGIMDLLREQRKVAMKLAA